MLLAPMLCPRSITACISRLPIPPAWRVGSTQIGPTPGTLLRSLRKLQPTIFPSVSRTASTPQIFGCIIHICANPWADSSVGKSRGKLWRSWIEAKASKTSCAVAGISAAVGGRRMIDIGRAMITASPRVDEVRREGGGGEVHQGVNVPPAPGKKLDHHEGDEAVADAVRDRIRQRDDQQDQERRDGAGEVLEIDPRDLGNHQE